MSLLMRPGLSSLVRWGSIIGVLIVTLSVVGCSAVRLGYNNAPNLTYWWLDRYFDFDTAQRDRLQADLQAALDWHRKEELPLLALQLNRLQNDAAKPATPEQLCGLYATLRDRAEAPLKRLLPTMAAIAPTLQSAQLEHAARQFDKRNREWREEWMDGTPGERAERRTKQLVDRAESFYGSLDSGQRGMISAFVAASGFDAATQYRETQRRQQDTLQTLRALTVNAPTPVQAQAEVRALLDRTLNPPDPAYRQYRDRLVGEDCAGFAALHNSINNRQRNKLIDTLRGYENDARALATQG
jgi:hypothetical protein